MLQECVIMQVLLIWSPHPNIPTYENVPPPTWNPSCISLYELMGITLRIMEHPAQRNPGLRVSGEEPPCHLSLLPSRLLPEKEYSQ